MAETKPTATTAAKEFYISATKATNRWPPDHTSHLPIVMSPRSSSSGRQALFTQRPSGRPSADRTSDACGCGPTSRATAGHR